MKTVYEFVGGRYHKMRMPKEAVEFLGNGCYSPDWSVQRALGGLVPREELDDQPQVDGYAGPMWDGLRKDGIDGETYAVLRYESFGVYDQLSR